MHSSGPLTPIRSGGARHIRRCFCQSVVPIEGLAPAAGKALVARKSGSCAIVEGRNPEPETPGGGRWSGPRRDRLIESAEGRR